MLPVKQAGMTPSGRLALELVAHAAPIRPVFPGPFSEGILKANVMTLALAGKPFQA